jgi:putative ABC transport system substrate-binding protein
MFDMRRRDFISLIGGAVAGWPLAARAQQPERMRRIGLLVSTAADNPEAQARKAAFLQGLQQLGWIEGRNVRIDHRWGAGDPERSRTNVAELVGLKPDVILASSALDMLALKRETSAIPIVFTMVYDPIRSGFVESLARPGGNVTGFTLGEFSLGGKMLELLKEMAPQVNRVAVVLNPNQPPHVAMLQAIEAVASSFAVRVTAAEVKNAAEIEPAIDVFAREPNGGLIVVPSPIVSAHRELVAALAARYRLPAIYGYRDFVKSGGMVSYGADPTDMFRRAALYVDRILKGEKPGELPVQNPNKFELIVNLKTAKALGLTISESFLLRADEVIE